MSDSKLQEEGVLQVSVLIVILYAYAINGISSVIPVDVMFTLFVDDLSLSAVAFRISVAECKLQLTVHLAVGWAAEHGFKFSV